MSFQGSNNVRTSFKVCFISSTCLTVYKWFPITRALALIHVHRPLDQLPAQRAFLQGLSARAARHHVATGQEDDVRVLVHANFTRHLGAEVPVLIYQWLSLCKQVVRYVYLDLYYLTSPCMFLRLVLISKSDVMFSVIREQQNES